MTHDNNKIIVRDDPLRAAAFVLRDPVWQPWLAIFACCRYYSSRCR